MKGINSFTDMTNQEFFDYFQINKVGEAQNCSATARQ